MREDALFTLMKSTLTDGFTARAVAGVGVKQRYQPQIQGVPSTMTVFMDVVLSKRYGHMRRTDAPIFPKPVAEFTHTELQWWETTLQISGLSRRNPEKPAEMDLPSAMDLVRIASDILQGDRGLKLLAVQRVRPLRVTDIRKVPFLNDSDQWDSSPSFDIVLSYPDSVITTTPAAEIENNVTRV